MGDASVPDHSAGVNLSAADIRWTLEPLPRPEDDDPIDLFALSHADLLSYTFSLQDDLRALRDLLHEALAELQRLTQQAARYRLRLESLLAQFRTRRRTRRDEASA